MDFHFRKCCKFRSSCLYKKIIVGCINNEIKHNICECCYHYILLVVMCKCTIHICQSMYVILLLINVTTTVVWMLMPLCAMLLLICTYCYHCKMSPLLGYKCGCYCVYCSYMLLSLSVHVGYVSVIVCDFVASKYCYCSGINVAVIVLSYLIVIT